MDKFKKIFLYGINKLAWAIGLLLLLMAIVAVIRDPGLLEAYLMAGSFLMMSALFIPRSVNYLNTKLNNRLTILVRSILIFILIMVGGRVSSNIEPKRFEAMSPEDREVVKNQMIVEYKEKIAEEKKVREEKYAEKTKVREEEEVESENERQEKFYAELSAPRILYKCKNSLLVKAYGSKYGTYNQLFENAYKDCGEDNLEIIEKEK